MIRARRVYPRARAGFANAANRGPGGAGGPFPAPRPQLPAIIGIRVVLDEDGGSVLSGAVPPRFEFGETWVLPHDPAVVGRVLAAIEYYPRWWPQVTAVARLGPDAAWVICRSRLPYSLNLVLEARSRRPPILECAISGDLTGFARWRLEARAAGTVARYEQIVELTDPLLAPLARALRPVLEWNHRQMMRSGRRGLLAYLTADGAASGIGSAG